MADDGMWKQFERDGVHTVRARLLEWQGHVKAEAIAWLAHKDEEERARSEASQASQIRIARSAERAAWIAAIAAIIAAVSR
jgi:hypothetical protein